MSNANDRSRYDNSVGNYPLPRPITLTQPMMEPPKVHCITAFDVMWRHLNVRILCILEISIFSVALDVLCNILSGSIPLDVDKNNSASIETHPEHH